MNSQEIDQLFKAFDILLYIVGFSSAFIGFLIGWLTSNQYHFRRWLKAGIYCDDCAPVVNRLESE